jgi:uncharacterized protein RhaS with RHS repeats
MGARTYVPAIGRFEQPDPVSRSGPNAYAYTAGDPVNQADPSGNVIVTYSDSAYVACTDCAALAAAYEAYLAEQAAATSTAGDSGVVSDATTSAATCTPGKACAAGKGGRIACVVVATIFGFEVICHQVEPNDPPPEPPVIIDPAPRPPGGGKPKHAHHHRHHHSCTGGLCPI